MKGGSEAVRVIVALASMPTVRELVSMLSRLGVKIHVPRPGESIRSGNCILVYDDDLFTSMYHCNRLVRIDRDEEPVIAAARILSLIHSHRFLRIGVDVGSDFTVAIVLNSIVASIAKLPSFSDMEAFVCKIIEAYKPSHVIINVGKEGVTNLGLNMERLCGIKVRLVDEGRTNTVHTALHDAEVVSAGRRRDRIAALNIALA